MRRLFFLLLVTIGCDFGSPEEPTPSVLAKLHGTFVGELYCSEETSNSRGTATLVLQHSAEEATGNITFTGEQPSPFTTTAQLTLWLDEDGNLDGAWSDCQIEGGEYGDQPWQVTCQFWHQEQDETGYIFKPNNWLISEDGETFTLENAPIESEAQKCFGDLIKTP